VAPELACGTIGVLTPIDRRTPEGATGSTQSILTWVATVTANLPPSQSRTLAVLVAAAIHTERPNLATIGRRLAGPTTAKSAIKRAWRLTDNGRVEVADAPPDPGAWDRSVAAFRADLAAIMGLVADPATDLFAPLPHGQGQTVLREALLAADHNAYHIGQLVTVRRLLGAWHESA
jgi:hypothetical protein